MGTRLIKQYMVAENKEKGYLYRSKMWEMWVYTHISHIFAIKATQCLWFLLYMDNSED